MLGKPGSRVGLRVHLGKAPGHPHKGHFPIYQGNINTPARQRRRAWRDASRKEKQAEETADSLVINKYEKEANEEKQTITEIHVIEDFPEEPEHHTNLDIIDDELFSDEEYYKEID